MLSAVNEVKESPTVPKSSSMFHQSNYAKRCLVALEKLKPSFYIGHVMRMVCHAHIKPHTTLTKAPKTTAPTVSLCRIQKINDTSLDGVAKTFKQKFTNVP